LYILQVANLKYYYYWNYYSKILIIFFLWALFPQCTRADFAYEVGIRTERNASISHLFGRVQVVTCWWQRSRPGNCITTPIQRAVISSCHLTTPQECHPLLTLSMLTALCIIVIIATILSSSASLALS